MGRHSKKSGPIVFNEQTARIVVTCISAVTLIATSSAAYAMTTGEGDENVPTVLSSSVSPTVLPTYDPTVRDPRPSRIPAPTTTVAPPTAPTIEIVKPPPTRAVPRPTTVAPPPSTTKPKPEPTIEPTTEKPKPKPTPKPEPKEEPVTKRATGDSRCSNIGLKDKAEAVCKEILGGVGQYVDAVGGKAGRTNASCHPTGEGIDLMVSSSSDGDKVNEWVRNNKVRLDIGWIGWRVRDHYDHVHVSILPCTH